MSLLGHMALLKLSPQPHFPLMKPVLVPVRPLHLSSERKGVAAENTPVPPVQAAREKPRASQPHPAPLTPLNLALPSPAV